MSESFYGTREPGDTSPVSCPDDEGYERMLAEADRMDEHAPARRVPQVHVPHVARAVLARKAVRHA